MIAVFTRCFAIAAAFVAGYFLPELSVLSGLIRWLIVAMLFMTFLGLKARRMRLTWKHGVIVGVNLAVGAGAYVLLEWAGCRELGQAAFFAGVAPTATAAPVITGLLGGDVGFVTTALLADSAAVCLLLPVCLPAVTGQGGTAVYYDVAASVFVVMVLPLLLAWATRRVYPRAFLWTGRLKDVSFGLWVAALLLIVANASWDIRHGAGLSDGLLWQVGVASLLICALNFTLGYLIGGSDRRRECSQSLGQKNTTLTIVLAISYANPVAALGPTFYVLWHNLWNAIQLYRSAARMRRLSGKAGR